tara:strand:+ start:280 stop:1977 length:1698 start_codon:yes stop_codon:yes gene_type:complete
MCGILGGNLFDDEDRITKGLQSMMHRGTDGNVIFSFKDNMYLSHNRLSIQDLSEIANQPLVSDDSRYYLAFNGELWKTSFEKFDKKLRKKYNFKTTNSDSELLLYYLIDNLKNIPLALKELDGMFCFALYDSEMDITYLGRDFIGRLPFYYTMMNDRFAFSSEAKGLVIGLDLPYYKLDVRSKKYKVKEYKDKENIHPIEPGTLLTFKPSKTYKQRYELTKTKWFEFKEEYNKKNQQYYTRTESEFRNFDRQDKGLDYYVNGFRGVLETAVDNETISDVPICTILSGGIDSTIITYLLSKKFPNLEAFVVNVNRRRNSKVKDDLYYARMAAKEFGIKLNVVSVDRDDIEKVLKESIWATESHKWTQIAPAVAQLFLSWEIRDRGFKVVFGGEGADEIFASYGDVKRFCWNKPIEWHKRRVNLVQNLYKNNLIRTNKAMMYGGKVELRTPFLNKEVIDFGLRIPTKYRDENYNKRKKIDVLSTKVIDGNIMKFVLRKAFEGEISDELVWRPKKTFQVGCHTDYLKKEQDKLDDYFQKLFVDRDIEPDFLYRSLGHTQSRINIEIKT